MRFIGKLDQDKHGVGSVIGATFLVFILLSGFTFYILTVNINDGYTAVLQTMDQLDLQRKQENVEFVGISTTNEDKLNVTVKNAGPHQTHLIWLGIFDETVTPNIQEYHKMAVYINPAETLSNLPEENITILEGQERVIQLVTELGNTFNSNYPPREEATITITGKNCTTTHNPSQWNLLGSTEHASGSISDLANNDTNYVVFRSYGSGSKTNITLLDDGFEGPPPAWDANWNQYGTTDWSHDAAETHSGSWSASGLSSSTYLTSDDIDTSGVSFFYVEFWYRNHWTESGDFRLYYWDGSQYDLVQDLGALDPEDTWFKYSQNVTNSQYFRSDFRIRFDCAPMVGGEQVWVDDVLVKKQVADEQTAEVEFIGSSNLEAWTGIIWQISSSWDTDSVNVTIQLYNYTLGGYSTSGNGYVNHISSATPNVDELQYQTITLNLGDFKNSTGHWQVKIKGSKFTMTQFQMKVNWIELQTTYSSTGETLPYNAQQLYTIKATSESGDPIPYYYVSIYANGTNVTFRSPLDNSSIPNPGWVRLDAYGEYQIELRSAHTSSETFVLHAALGSVLGQKTITQEAP